MDNRLTPQQQDALIEDALQTYPLAPIPRDITAGVLTHIKTNPSRALITWSDFGLSLVIALSVGALFFALQNIPPIAFAKMRIQTILLYQDIIINAHWLVPTLFFGLATFLSALAIPYLRRELTR
jgi:hypothetical protein